MRARRSAVLFVLLSSLLLILLGFPLAAHAVTTQPAFEQLASPLGSAVTTCWALGMGDFNGDGFDDILSANTAGDVYYHRGSGSATFTAGVRQVNAPFWDTLSLATGDFNADGKLDFAAPRTGGSSVVASDGVIYVFLGNGDGTFQRIGAAGSEQGLPVGDGGTDVVGLTSADVDGDTDLDLVSSDLITGAGDAAQILLWRNEGNGADGKPTWGAAETISSMPSQTVDPEMPPYYPPKATGTFPQGYGLAMADMDADGDADLLVTDTASYVYLYANDGRGHFEPVRYDAISTGTRPYALMRAHETFARFRLPVAAGDVNGDSRPDFVLGGSDGVWDGKVDLWLNEGVDSVTRRPEFTGAGFISPDTPTTTRVEGLAIGQLNANEDSFRDVVYGGWNFNLYGLKADLTDTDGDGIINRSDNLPLVPNFPRIDLNGDGTINRYDQMDLDGDGIGSVLDPVTHALLGDDDADGDGVANADDNLSYVPNASQTDADGDGVGEVTAPYQGTLGDPLDDRDPDGDGVKNGPFDPSLRDEYREAKRKLMLGDTPFVIRIDALGRWWQAEFTQTLADSVHLSEAEFATKWGANWDGTYGEPTNGAPPVLLDGGKGLPVTLALIPKLVWTDPGVVGYLNDRMTSSKFELAQHGTYHNAIQPAGDPIQSEMTGYDPLEMFVYMKVGQQTTVGDYSATPDYLGAPDTAPRIDWSTSANPLISFCPPYDEFDRSAVEAISQLGYASFSSDIFVEGLPRTGMPDNSDKSDEFGVFHSAATFMPYAYVPSWSSAPDYESYIRSNITPGKANILLIEEVNFSGVDGANAVNNTIDPARWAAFQQVLDIVKTYPGGTYLTLGEYAMARAYDNAPGVANPDQRDDDHDGIGDAAATTLAASDATAVAGVPVTLRARLLDGLGAAAAGRTVTFTVDTNGDGTYDAANEPVGTAVTGSDGWAACTLTLALPASDISFQASFDGEAGLEPASPSVAALAVRLTATMTASDAAGLAGEPLALRARLTDGGGAGVAGKAVAFLVDADGDGAYDAASESVGTTLTDADGWADIAPTLALGAEHTTWKAAFATDATYLGASDTAALDLVYGTALSAEDATAVAGLPVTLRGELTAGTTPVSGKVVTFTVDANGDGEYDAATEPVGTGVTDGDGVATCTMTLSNAATATRFRVTFSGDADHSPALPASAALVLRHATTVLAQDNATKLPPPGMTSPRGALAATLKDGFTGAPLAGASLTFYLDRDRDGATDPAEAVGAATTNASGVAWVRMPRGATKYTTYLVAFNGTPLYLPSQDGALLSVGGRK